MIKSSKKIAAKQKKLFLTLAAGCIGLVALLVSFTSSDESDSLKKKNEAKQKFDVVSSEVDPDKLRLSALETLNDTLSSKLGSLEQSLLSFHKAQKLAEEEKRLMENETLELQNKMNALEEVMNKPEPEPEAKKNLPNLKGWEILSQKDNKHVSFEIPAGTVVKAILVSGADCSVAVQKPTGPNMVLLRPLDNGHLPRNVRVPLKGSVIIGNAIGDLSSERVYIRAERMSLVERGGSFTDTELSAYVSGEDGREGMRGVVVDRSGQIIARAAFAAFLNGAAGAADTLFNLRSLDSDSKTKGMDILRGGALQGGTTAMNKMTDYYIKRAEQLQPAIQIAAGRVVDVVFTKTVKVGEKDLKKKFDMERAAKRSLHE
jgi:conjugal transfer pilus assembly protein TraB